MPTTQQLDNRTAWIDALKSGKYQQGRNRLRNRDNTFCCLGVAADVAGVEQETEPEVSTCFGFKFDENGFEWRSMPPVQWFADRFGIAIGQASEMTGALASDNDRGRTFDTIAFTAGQFFERFDNAV